MTPNARPWIFVDLDDSLFQTLRKDTSGHRLAAVDRDGRPLSFQTDRQAALWSWLIASAAHVIPTTGRNKAALDRVRLTPRCRTAITSFGGLIWQGDVPDPDWLPRIRQATAEVAPMLAHLRDRALLLADDHGLDVRATIVTDFDLPLYLSIKHNAGNAAETAAALELIRPDLPPGWAVHLNAHNCALRPPFLDKRHAVGFLMDRADPQPALSIGLGDSLSDLPFLLACDLSLIPRATQMGDHLRDLAEAP